MNEGQMISFGLPPSTIAHHSFLLAGPRFFLLAGPSCYEGRAGRVSISNTTKKNSKIPRTPLPPCSAVAMAPSSSSSAPTSASAPARTSQLPPRAAPISNPLPLPSMPASFTSQGALIYALAPNRVFTPPPPPPPSRPLSSSDQLVTVANLGKNVPLLPFPLHPHPRLPYGTVTDHGMRPSSSQALSKSSPPQMAAVAPPVSASGSRSLPALHHSKVDQIPTITSITEYKIRDKNSDPFVVVNGRKVRVSDGASTSLYALCRSWVRNGLPQDNQPHFGESGRPLPRRPPISVRPKDTLASVKNGVHDDDMELSGKEECAGSVDNMSVGELLKEHVKRAKKVRARIREERLQQIHPYRQRLYSIIERIQQAEADPTVGNSDVLSVFARPFKAAP